MILAFNPNRLFRVTGSSLIGNRFCPSFLRRSLCSTLLALATTMPAWAESAPAPKDSVSAQSRLPLDELRAFTEVMERIKKAYVEEVDDKTLLENAIHGMLSGLDPHSAYLTPDDFRELEENTSGEFGGLGIEVGLEDGFIKVISPIDDTPAVRAGIQARDLIIKLDGSSVKGMSLSESVEKMRGKVGTKVQITIRRDGAEKPLEITLERAIIRVQSVKSKSLAPGYGYIRISQFQSDTGKELVQALSDLTSKKAPLHGLVLDLRNNPGGVLQAAVDVTDAFIHDGLIVYTQGRIPNSELRFNASKEDPSRGVPLVVLINGGSASASEIVAGALQDHNRAVVLGTSSFGKGSVQTVLPLNVDAAKGIKLTTALYYTPSGRSIQAEGIQPDILVKRAKVTPIDAPQRYKEADLQRHLGNKNAKDSQSGNRPGKSEQEISDLLAQDYQLSQALNVLKGMHINAITTDKPKAAETAALKASKVAR